MVGQVLLESIHHLPQPMLMALTSIPAASVHHMTKTIASVVSPSAVWYNSLGFVRSGNVALNTGAMRNFGIHGYGWSRIATVYGAGTWDTIAYSLNFYASGVAPSGNNVRWYGFPVRCLVILVCCVSVPTFEVMTARRAEPGQNHGPSFSEGFDFERLTWTEKVGTETH